MSALIEQMRLALAAQERAEAAILCANDRAAITAEREMLEATMAIRAGLYAVDINPTKIADLIAGQGLS